MNIFRRYKVDDEICDYIESHLDSDVEKILNGEQINMGNKSILEFDEEGVYRSLIHKISRQERRRSQWRGAVRWLSATAAVIIAISAFYYHPWLGDENVVINDIYARKGEKMMVILADGSRVSLNADTHLYYPAKFTGDTREVRVEGEAYFEVSKDASKPFIVKAHEMQIKVTGTKFNVKAYPESGKIITTLDEGCVLVGKDSAATKYVKLKPGEYAEYDKISAECRVGRLQNALESSGWKNNMFVFRDAPIEEVLSVLERNYNVSFAISNEKIKAYTYNITCPTTDMDDVIEIIETVTPVKFIKTGDYEYELK